jgi:phosphoribosyl 1,2-cyclic phosphodiesterase
LESGDWLIFLDAGSGIQNLKFEDHLDNRRVDILLTHLHIDHIQGLGFFKPLFNASTEVHIWGPSSNSKNLRSRLGRYFSPPLFPVYFRNLTCKLFIHEIGCSEFEIGPFTIQSDYVIHPGPTVGFRIQESDKVFTYIPDHEPMLGRKEIFPDVKWLSGSELAKHADLLLHDAQYTMKEYEEKVGWGHSAMEHALQFGDLSKVKHMLLSHHDPMHSDHLLDDLYDHLKTNVSYPFPFEFAVEGSSFTL